MIVEQKLKEIEDLKPGTKFNNESLRELFLCSPQGGMRRSSKTNTLVLICNHIQSIYDDEWKNDVLYYTGMGQTGDQSFYFMQNKTLFESNDNGVQIHLFEVFKDKEYTYTGKVKLAGKPFTGEQQDSLGKTRVVCIFPLKLLNNRLVLSDDIDSAFSIKEKEARKLSDDELKHRIAQSPVVATKYKQVSDVFKRNPYLAELVKRRANGVCQLCEKEAPFKTADGTPYLECHHIEWLSRGGNDDLTNTVALCPNCHKKMHLVDALSDVKFLKSKASIAI